MVTKPLALQPPALNVRLRPVRQHDAVLLQRRCWPERPLAGVREFIGRAQRLAENQRGLGVVVLDDDHRVAGYGQIALWMGCAEISDLIVADSLRGRGIGTTMIQYLVRVAREMHVDCVEIGGAYSNPRAIALYRRLGFSDHHTLSLNLGHGNEPVLFLRLDLHDTM
ncbi:MAG: GNAT family N-acetyltransferase [Chloroflexi bacterium]|nr:MAG: GNAT family N-acetyltransferase [Chloroflexota bacterium]